MRKIAILGSTGSIGKQALEVISLHPDLFQVTALTAHRNAELLFEQVRTFRPKIAALTFGKVEIPQELKFCQWYFGHDALTKVAEESDADDVLASVVGIAGLHSVLSARRAGKRILLANKETLVAGGELVMKACQTDSAQPALLPVDSEHSAIFQCLQAAQGNPVSQILLTASGGPFRTWDKESMLNATVEQALGHPTWSMGRKITIDSATMFNKALEIIEAKWLFGVNERDIQVLVHPQSIVHSAVSFSDGAVIAQMGCPDMHLPILYAMSYPKRLETGVQTLDLTRIGQLTFEKPDTEKYPSIGMAYEALQAGGTGCCILNAANEVAAEAFLAKRISFGRIFEVVQETLQAVPVSAMKCVEDIGEADFIARNKAKSLIES